MLLGIYDIIKRSDTDLKQLFNKTTRTQLDLLIIIPTNPVADDIATAPSGLVFLFTIIFVFIYPLKVQTRCPGNILFNDALNTFLLRLHDVRHMVKDHSDSERVNPLPPLHGLLFPISSKDSFICIITQTG